MTLTAPGSVQADSSAGGPIPPNPARGLICRNCGATFGLIAEHACAECFGPLEVDYDKDLLRAVTREQIEAGPQNIWRYVALLPVGHDPADRVTLDPGLTPLVRADRLAEELGVPVFGSIPLDPRIRECADAGEPIVWEEPESLAAQTILRIARAIDGTKREQGVGIVKALPVLS